MDPRVDGFERSRTEDAFLELLGEHRQAQRLVIHLDEVGRIDTTAAPALRSLTDDARRAGLAVELADVRPRWRRLVDGVIEREKDPLGTEPDSHQ